MLRTSRAFLKSEEIRRNTQARGNLQKYPSKGKLKKRPSKNPYQKHPYQKHPAPLLQATGWI